VKTVCPNCGSQNFVETVSLEFCPDCNIKCDYWGSGANQEYNQMCRRNWLAQEREQEMLDRQAEENW
jgi:hypothetical protein